MSHGVRATEGALETIRATARTIAEALPDDPNTRPNAAKVVEVIQRASTVWRKVKTITDGAEEARAGLFKEQIELEALALSAEPDSPEVLRRAAESALRASQELVALQAQGMMGRRQYDSTER